MTVATREQIMDALLARLQTLCGDTFLTYSRRFIMWEQIAQAMQNGAAITPNGQPLRQPALMLFDGMGLGGGIDRYAPKSRSLPPIVTLFKTIVIYAQIPGGDTPQGPDFTTPGGTVFNPLIESVAVAVGTPDDAASGANTLGGLVSHCWLEGDGLMMTGEIDPGEGQGMVTLPVRIMMYPSL